VVRVTDRGGPFVRALVVTEFGDEGVLRWQEVADPVPGPGELLVRTRAFAVNWADLLQRQGRYPGGPTPPYVSGHDLVGEVVGRGPDTAGPSIGTRVFGVLGSAGAAAELVAAPASWFHVVPDGIGDEEAAGLAAPFLTAGAAVVEFGRLQPGESVLVHAAAGGYGSAAVQLARYHGASTIVATAGSDEKLEQVRELGADVLVNYRTDDFVPVVAEVTGGRGVDLVLESVGGDVLARSFDCLAPLGRLVSVGASSGESTRRFRLHTLFELGISVAGFTLGRWLQDDPELVRPIADRVVEALRSGGVRPVVGGVFAAADVGDAHRFLAERRSVGRTVVVMEP
jgi:NADPH:quinone reductase